jgi:hypothetical protein
MVKSELYGIQSVLGRRRVRGRQECLVQWEPTFESIDVEEYAFDKYRPEKVSERVYLIDGEFKRKVDWKPSWEPSRNVGIPVLIETVSKSVAGVDFSDESGLTPGWELRMSPRCKNLYFYCPETNESCWDPPEGMSVDVALMCILKQLKLSALERKRSGVA